MEGPSPSAKSVRKVIETNNPAWRVPAGRRVAKFVKKHEQTTAKSSSTVSSEDETVLEDDSPSDAPATPKVTSRRGMLALGASLSVRRLLSGSAHTNEPRRELKSKLSFRKKKLQVAGKRPSLTHVTAHDSDAQTKAAEPAPPSPTAVSSPLSLEDKDFQSFVSDDDEDVVEPQKSDRQTEEKPAEVVNEASIEVAKETTTEVDVPTKEVLNTDATVMVEEKSVAVQGELHAASALFYQDDNDGKISKSDICGGCVIS